MNDLAGGRVGRRIGRILLLLPYAIKHPGVSVDELANKFGIKKKELMDDLNLVFLCGLPGYGPGDLIDVMVDDDRIYVRMADYFGAPLRLTPAEALALYASAAAIASVPGMEEADALNRALDKLRKALGADADPEGAVKIALEGGSPEHLGTIEQALETERRIKIEYRSASRGELTERAVDPWGLIAALGRWYLVGLDHLSDEERMFRVDRIKSVSIVDEPAPVPGDFDPTAYRGAWRGSGDQTTVTFEISPATARWFGDYYPVISSSEAAGGWQRVELASSGERWLATLLLQLGNQVRNVLPERSLEAARALAERVSALYA